MYSRVSQSMPRVLVLLFSLSVVSMLYVANFGTYIDDQFQNEKVVEFSSKQPSGAEDGIQSKYRREVQTLQERIKTLENMLESTDKRANSLTNQISHQSLMIRTLQEYRNNTEQQKLVPKAHNLNDTIQSAEVLKGVSLKSEYELIPFTRFTMNKIFLVEPGLGKRVIEKPIGYKRKDILNVVVYAVDQINQNRTKDMRQYSVDDFIEGLYRTEPISGTLYELFFRDIDNPQRYTYRKMTVIRPFTTLHNIADHKQNTSQTWINLILPLSGRLESFHQFMLRFVRVVIKQDKRVFLTVVYFGTDGLDKVKTNMSAIAKEHKYKHMKLVTLKEEFSRGRGLQVGAFSWKTTTDVLMFLCDVDIAFTVDFLERCRVNSQMGQKVYYPITFSLYNPNVVYNLQDMPIPSEREQLVITRNTGFWRDFGYGMTCQYMSDFKAVKGFDEHISGWGGEDVFLYQKYVKSDYMVVRATDPGIFHLWHEKHCDPKLNLEQYRSCIRSKALNEASHPQLGLLAFKDEINLHINLSKNQSMAVPKMGPTGGPKYMKPQDLYPPEN